MKVIIINHVRKLVSGQTNVLPKPIHWFRADIYHFYRIKHVKEIETRRCCRNSSIKLNYMANLNSRKYSDGKSFFDTCMKCHYNLV